MAIIIQTPPKKPEENEGIFFILFFISFLNKKTTKLKEIWLLKSTREKVFE